MTCIVGMVVNGSVYMAGDHIGTNLWNEMHYSKQKVFFNNDFLIGFTGSFRMGQILEYSWVPPKRTKKDKTDFDYLVNKVVPSLMDLYKKQGFLKTETGEDNGRLSGGTFLFGYRGHLYTIQNDFSVLEDSRGYGATGCGEEVATGALCVLYKDSTLSPEEKLKIALEAAEQFCAPVKVDWDKFVVYKL